MQQADSKRFHDPWLLYTWLLTTKGKFMVVGYITRKRKNREITERVYREIARCARRPDYYLHMNVPDTVMGRFEMISVVMVLFLRRAESGSEALRQLSGDVVDHFFAELDHSIRELGVGDLSVPKRMKKLARMFYGRAESYSGMLDSGNARGLAEALRRNIHPDTGTRGQGAVQDADMSRLAKAVIEIDDIFAHQDEQAILLGEMSLTARPAGS